MVAKADKAEMSDNAQHSIDRILLRDHVVHAEIGAYQGERGRRQRLRFSIFVDVTPTRAGDDVDRIVSYDLLTEAIATELAAERVNLVETLAERIAARVLAPETAVAARIMIEKLDLGPGALGVEIVRHRRDVHPECADPVRPGVCFMSNAAIADAGLSRWLDRRAGVPTILCVGLPDVIRPRVTLPAPQHRIDLLAIEQNAWILAARDARCIVRQTRTELEWAAGRGEVSVWAPSKLVLDIAGAPGPDGPQLASWLAKVLDAKSLCYVGVDAPPGVDAAREDIA